MSELQSPDFAAITESLRLLLASQQTVLLATANKDGLPDISYAPFVRDETGCFYIYISQLATHTRNLLENPLASLMFIRSESETSNLFARERAIFNGIAEEILPQNENYVKLLDELQTNFGNVLSVLRTLNDFHLYALRPQSGRYVQGFGKAFAVNVADDTVSAI